MRLATKVPNLNLLILWWLWQCQLACALLLQQQMAGSSTQQQQQQQQQQQPQATQIIAPDGSNGAIIQAISQLAASGQMQINQTAANPAAGANSNQFVIKFIHNDTKNHMAYVQITPVNYTNMHEPRIELRYQSKYPFVSLDERAPNNTVVAAVVVYDEDSGPNGETSLSIEHGNEMGHFKIVSTSYTNTIQVCGAPLSKLRNPEYNLTIVARDHGSPPKSSSTNLIIKLQTSTASPIYGIMDPPASSLKPPVTDLMYVGAMLVFIFFALLFLIIIGCALVQRPKNKTHKGAGGGSLPTQRATSASNSRIHPSDQCSVYCHRMTNIVPPRMELNQLEP